MKEDNIQETLITGDVHVDFILLGIFGFVYDFISFVEFCFGFLFAMGFFPNAVVGPWEVLVMYLKSYQGFNKKNKKFPVTHLSGTLLLFHDLTDLHHSYVCCPDSAGETQDLLQKRQQLIHEYVQYRYHFEDG